MQSTNIAATPDAYGQMSSMTSGSCSSSFLNPRSSFRESSNSFNKSNNNSNVAENTEDDNSNEDAVYNLPWENVKNKANQLQQAIEAASQNNTVKSQQSVGRLQPPPPPQCPPPSTENSMLINANKAVPEEDESQYCAPWDLKLQEEMFKMMSQSKKNTDSANTSTTTTATINNKSANSPNVTSNSDEIINRAHGNESLNNSGLAKNNNELNSSIRSNKSLNEKPSSIDTSPSNEYSPPWELKQTALMQSLQSQNSLKQHQTSSQTHHQQLIQNMPAPLNTSSAASTLTSSNNQNQSALTTLFNQFSRTRLSTRSNTSSSSSTRSSTSSLSASSPPSIPPPPLPPSIPPPPPPTSSTVNRCNSSCNHSHHIQQSPRLQHRHLSQTNSASNLPGNHNNNGLLMSSRGPGSNAIVPGMNHSIMNSNQCNSCSLKKSGNVMSQSHHQNGCGTGSSCQTNYLNESKFSSWSSTNTNSFENSNCASSNDETKAFCRQSRGGSSHHFAYPSIASQFQTVPSNGQHNETTLNKNIQINGMPVTALVFANNSLPASLLPLNIQNPTLQQHHSTGPTNHISPKSLSHLHLLERQMWFHGRITRKHAENMLDNRSIGSFLIRQSESGNATDFSLSLVGSGVVHMRISMKNGEYILGQCSQPFNSIVKMVEHYGKVEVPIKGALHVRLTNPVPK